MKHADGHISRLCIHFVHVIEREHKSEKTLLTSDKSPRSFSSIVVFTAAARSMADLILSGVVLLSFYRPGDLIHRPLRSITPAVEGIKTYGA
jgi:hypothetical protein